MDFMLWFQTLSAVLYANGLTILFLWGLWTVTRVEKMGFRPEDAPFLALVSILIPSVVAVIGLYTVTR